MSAYIFENSLFVFRKPLLRNEQAVLKYEQDVLKNQANTHTCRMALKPEYYKMNVDK